MLSHYCSSIENEYDKHIGGVIKLVPNLGNKNKYVLYYRNLELHLSLDMKLAEVHRILKFKQSDWLEKYIDFNTDKTRNAANSFEKFFFKLINNRTFRKTMGNVTKRINIRLVNNAGDYERYVSKPSFVSQKIFSKNSFAIHKIKSVLTLDKRIYVGFSILELSKLFTYEFHYKCINRKYNAKMLFTNTDSLVDEIETEDVYEDFYEDKNLFNFSDYPRDSKFSDPVNQKVIGKIKDEFKRTIISEFVGLKSKMYFFIAEDGEEIERSR